MLQNSINNKKRLFYYSQLFINFKFRKEHLYEQKLNTDFWCQKQFFEEIVLGRDDNENQLIIKFEICAHDRSK